MGRPAMSGFTNKILGYSDFQANRTSLRQITVNQFSRPVEFNSLVTELLATSRFAGLLGPRIEESYSVSLSISL
jgi:hypothetical protein